MKWVYTFGNGAAEGRAGDVAILGGKGANLAEMASLGLPVPPASPSLPTPARFITRTAAISRMT